MARSFSILMLAVPSFWLGTMVMVFPSIWWGWSPPIQFVPFSKDPIGNLSQMIIPSIILGCALSAITMRLTRTMMLEVLRQDFIRTAQAKGASRSRLLWRHALPNALIPVITIMALSFGGLFSGALVTETMFAYPGMGKLIYDAIMGNDFNLALIGLLFATLLTLAGNLLADIAYAWLDPRISYGGGEART